MGKKLRFRTRKEKVVNEQGQVVQIKMMAQPLQTSRILCLLLNENKTSEWVFKKRIVQRFSHRGNTYYLQPEGMYITPNNVIVAVFMEGVSTPLGHRNIEKITKKVMIENPETGKPEERSIIQIKGLKYDSKLIDMLLNRDLFAEFTKSYLDIPQLLLIVLLAINVILNIGGIIAVLS
jgi:hypothetical protein